MIVYTADPKDTVSFRRWDEILQGYVDVVLVGYRWITGRRAQT